MRGKKFYYIMSTMKKPMVEVFDKHHVFMHRLLDYPQFCMNVRNAHVYVQTPEGKYKYYDTVSS